MATHGPVKQKVPASSCPVRDKGHYRRVPGPGSAALSSKSQRDTRKPALVGPPGDNGRPGQAEPAVTSYRLTPTLSHLMRLKPERSITLNWSPEVGLAK